MQPITKPRSVRPSRVSVSRCSRVLVSRSSPGRYSLHEFPKQVYNFKATDGQGHALTVSQPFDYQLERRGPQGHGGGGIHCVRRPRRRHLRRDRHTHAHLICPQTFAYAHGFEKNPVSIQVHGSGRLGLEGGDAARATPRRHVDRDQHGSHDGQPGGTEQSDHGGVEDRQFAVPHGAAPPGIGRGGCGIRQSDRRHHRGRGGRLGRLSAI